jgi:hypothetical protein
MPCGCRKGKLKAVQSAQAPPPQQIKSAEKKG